MKTTQELKRIDKIVGFYAHDYRDMKLSEDDLSDVIYGVLEAIDCTHECRSDCRRDGCNCDCGQYHFSIF